MESKTEINEEIKDFILCNLVLETELTKRDFEFCESCEINFNLKIGLKDEDSIYLGCPFCLDSINIGNCFFCIEKGDYALTEQIFICNNHLTIKYHLKDWLDFTWIIQKLKNGEEKSKFIVIPQPDRLASKILEKEDILKTEFGTWIFNNEIFQLSNKYIEIKKIMSDYFGYNSYWNTIAEKNNWISQDLPMKKLTRTQKLEVIDSIDSKLPELSHNEIFNTIPLKNKDFVLPVNNGLFHFETMKLLPFNAGYKLTYKLTTNFIHPKDDKEVLNHLKEWLNYVNTLVDIKEVKDLQEDTGYISPIQRTGKQAIWNKGINDSGKTTYWLIIASVSGEKNYASVSFRKLMNPDNNKFAYASMRNKCFNLCGDVGDKEIKDMEQFKNWLGGDPMDTEKKGKDAIENTYLTAKMIFTSNRNPNYLGIWEKDILNRLRLRIFKNPIQNPDNAFLDKWKSPKAKSAILFWLIHGLKRYRKDGFTNPQDTEYVRDQMEKEITGTFFSEVIDIHYEEDTLIFDLNYTITDEELYFVYELYCKKWGIQLKPKKRFLANLTRYLEKEFEEIQSINDIRKRITNPDTKKKYFEYSGLSIKEEYQDILNERKKEKNKTLNEFIF